jgi:hypothetical protein
MYNQNAIVVNTPSPLINGQTKLTIEFKAGKHWPILSVKILNGRNRIHWQTNKTSEAPLPLTTVIVDGTTYYASQTIELKV